MRERHPRGTIDWFRQGERRFPLIGLQEKAYPFNQGMSTFCVRRGLTIRFVRLIFSLWHRDGNTTGPCPARSSRNSSRTTPAPGTLRSCAGRRLPVPGLRLNKRLGAERERRLHECSGCGRHENPRGEEDKGGRRPQGPRGPDVVPPGLLQPQALGHGRVPRPAPQTHPAVPGQIRIPLEPPAVTGGPPSTASSASASGCRPPPTATSPTDAPDAHHPNPHLPAPSGPPA